MNSWDRSDSDLTQDVLGKKDLALAKQLCKAGTDHRKFMRMITLYMDITAPMYWWKEFDTYKVGTVRNSCSTMHKITQKEFTLDDFSYDKMKIYTISDLECVITTLNGLRARYLSSHDKEFWYSIIQLLPSSYNQRSTVMLNYEVLANIYHARKDHKLDEWHKFCKWIETLPYSELITGGDKE